MGLTEAFALHQALIVVGDAVLSTNGGVSVRAGLALRVVNETSSLFFEFDSLALKNAFVVVGLAVDTTDRVVVPGTVAAVVFIRAFAVALKSNTAAFSLALVEVGEAINSAFRFVDFGAIIAVGFINVAETIVTLPNSLAVQQALVVVGDAIGAADWDVGECLGALARRQHTTSIHASSIEIILQAQRHR